MRQDEQDPNSRSQQSTPARMDSSQLYPYHIQQAFVFSSPPTPPSPHRVRQYRSMTTPPPLPPKPIVYSTMNPIATHEDYQVSSSPLPLPPPALLPSPSRSPPPPTLPFPPPLPPPPEDEVSDELAMVLALSQSESAQKKLLEEQLINQEEEDLARALAASMLPNESNFPFPMNGTSESQNTRDAHRIQSAPYHVPRISSHVSLSNLKPSRPTDESSGPSIPHHPYSEFGRYDKWRIPNPPEKQQDEVPKAIEPQPNVVPAGIPGPSSVSLLPLTSPSPRRVKRSSTSSISSLPYNMPEPQFSELPKYSHNIDKSSSQETSSPGYPTPRSTDLSSEFLCPETILEFDDAAYARQLASEEEKILKQLNQSLYIEEGQQDGFIDQPKSSSTSYAKQNAEWHRPQTGRAVSHEEFYGHQYPQDARASLNCTTASASMPAFPAQDYSSPPIGRVNSHQPDIFQENRKAFVPITYPSLGSRRGSVSDTQSETSQTPSLLPHSDRPHLHLDVSQRSTAPAARRDSQSLPPQQIATTSTPNQKCPPSAGVPNVNQFIDYDLLCGVCTFSYSIKYLYSL